jgi:hypothetical protein
VPDWQRQKNGRVRVRKRLSYFDKQVKSLVNASPLKIRNLRATPVNCHWRVLAEDKLAGGVAEFDMFLRNAEIRN